MSNPQDETSDWYSQDAATFGDRVAAAREQSGVTSPVSGGESMDSPPDTGEVTPDMRAILNELREMRADMVARAEQMARLEKRLRLVMSESGE